jgi:putative membrane protein
MAVNLQHRRHVLCLAGVLAALTALLGIAPWHRQDWLLENGLVVLALPVLWLIYRYMPFSRLSWSLVFAFLCLHEIGAHYTYSEVPYDDWWRALTGHPLNPLLGWERNNFDRVIHFSYGLLLAYPIREIFFHLARARGFWSYFLPLDLTMSSSALYELIEWAAAEVFGGELGAAYTGLQGDQWDAQKDIALASCGALIAMTLTALVNRRCQRDFAREWADSLRIHPPP